MSSATLNVDVRCRLAWYARLLLIVASLLIKYAGIRIPHRWVVAVTNRSWWLQLGNGPWRAIRIDDQGQVIQ